MPVTPPSAEGTPAQKEPVIPAQELEFLVEFAVACQRLAVYPPSHPATQQGAQKALHKLRKALTERPILPLGITRDSIVIDDVHSDPRNRLVATLARKLHDEQLGAAMFVRGMDEQEMHDVITTLVGGSSMPNTPLGLGVPEEIVWPHARFFPLAYDSLTLTRTPIVPIERPAGGTHGETARLWLKLAKVALRGDAQPDEGHESVAGESDGGHTNLEGDNDRDAGWLETMTLPTPDEMASILNAQRADSADSGRAAAGVLIRLTEKARESTDSEAELIGKYLSDLIGALSQETLERLMSAQDSPDTRRRFLIAASEGLAADAMVALTRAAASAAKVAISSPMLRMLGKLAASSERGSEAEASLRTLILQSAAQWTGSEGSPEEYQSLLGNLAATAPDLDTLRGTMPLEPFSLVAVGLELDMVNETVLSAADQMIVEGHVTALFDALEASRANASETIDAIRAHILRPELLYRFLRVPGIEFPAIQKFASEMGPAASEPLLDLLSASSDRALRAKLLTLLAQLGTDVGPHAVARLPGAPWFVQRNLLELLGRLPALPPGLSLRETAKHPDARVRRAALKIILRDAARREEGLQIALEDADGDILRLALGALLEDCPPSAVPEVRKVYENIENEEDVRAMSLRVLASRKDPAMLETLLRLSGGAGGFFRRRRLQPKSPLLLAALASLAAHWKEDAKAARVLTTASSHPDPEIRSAIQLPRRLTPL